MPMFKRGSTPVQGVPQTWADDFAHMLVPVARSI